jgi:hypothetical protein
VEPRTSISIFDDAQVKEKKEEAFQPFDSTQKDHVLHGVGIRTVGEVEKMTCFGSIGLETSPLLLMTSEQNNWSFISNSDPNKVNTYPVMSTSGPSGVALLKEEMFSANPPSQHWLIDWQLAAIHHNRS